MGKSGYRPVAGAMIRRLVAVGSLVGVCLPRHAKFQQRADKPEVLSQTMLVAIEVLSQQNTGTH